MSGTNGTRQTLEHWKIDKLKNHRLNASVFGDIGSDADCQEFVDSIKEHGVLQPPVLAPDGTVIAGHRRKQGAARAGLTEIAVIVRRDLTDQASIDRAWFESNRNREMTTEQKARWFKERTAIVAAEAAERVKRTQLNRSDKTVRPAPSNLTEPEKHGESAEIVAKEVGMSRNTAKAAAAVVDAIDEAESKGDTETASHLRETLNTVSVSAAKREADKVSKPAKASVALREAYTDDAGNEVPEPLFHAWRQRDTFHKLCGKLKAIAGELRELQKSQAGRLVSPVTKAVDDAGKQLALAMPSVVDGKKWKSVGESAK